MGDIEMGEVVTGGLISSPRGSGGLVEALGLVGDVDHLVVNWDKRTEKGNGFGEESIGSCLNYLNPPPRGRNGGSRLAERRAAWCGRSNMPRINTARFWSDDSPRLSPTTLLGSPVMLHNSQALPSPTTGTYPFVSLGHESSVLISKNSNSMKDKCDEEDVDSSFMLKPVPFQCLGKENQAHNAVITDATNQTLVPLSPQKEYGCAAGFLQEANTKNYTTGSLSNIEVTNNTNSRCFPLQTSPPSFASNKAPHQEEQVHGEDMVSQQVLGGDRKRLSASMGRPSEDGYNWRKYGQKQVKGSEYPRSYYKCTYPNCPVTKKVERSHDGQITEIIYKGAHEGAHNHPKPQPGRRSALGSAFAIKGMGSAFAVKGTSETREDPGSYINNEGGSKDKEPGSGWRIDSLERTSSTSVVTELSDQASTAQAKHLGIPESAYTPELSSTLASHDEEEDKATQGSISLCDDADDVEPESKRRKKESCLIETNLASRAVREPSVVIQTDSEVDILDDGYRWRKYGQKVVKGNPNPRSYYKCTTVGCPVRRHVERASHDLKYVLTTYHGKHNHEVPAARNSSHVNSTAGNPSATNSNAQTSLTLPRSSNFPKLEEQVQDLVPHFEKKPDFSDEFCNVGGFGSDMKFGSSACYGMKLPPFPTSVPCGSYVNPNQNEAHHRTSITQVVPEFPISLPLNFPLPPNMEMTSYDLNNHGQTVVPVQSFLGAQRPKEDDMRFLEPKQDLRDDTVFDTNSLFNGSFTL